MKNKILTDKRVFIIVYTLLVEAISTFESNLSCEDIIALHGMRILIWLLVFIVGIVWLDNVLNNHNNNGMA